MILYILRESDPAGGYFSAQDFKPDSSHHPTLNEVRVVENFPEDIWDMVLQGGLPVDPDHSNDSTWVEWWPEAQTVWVR